MGRSCYYPDAADLLLAGGRRPEFAGDRRWMVIQPADEGSLRTADCAGDLSFVEPVLVRRQPATGRHPTRGALSAELALRHLAAGLSDEPCGDHDLPRGDGGHVPLRAGHRRGAAGRAGERGDLRIRWIYGVAPGSAQLHRVTGLDALVVVGN